jgi:hypothetical protein
LAFFAESGHLAGARSIDHAAARGENDAWRIFLIAEPVTTPRAEDSSDFIPDLLAGIGSSASTTPAVMYISLSRQSA